jgi:hypothetical protein
MECKVASAIVFDWNLWMRLIVVGFAHPQSWRPYDQMGFNIALYSSIYLHVDELIRSKYVIEVTFIKSENVAHQQPTSTTKILIFKANFKKLNGYPEQQNAEILWRIDTLLGNE